MRRGSAKQRDFRSPDSSLGIVAAANEADVLVVHGGTCAPPIVAVPYMQLPFSNFSCSSSSTPTRSRPYASTPTHDSAPLVQGTIGTISPSSFSPEPP